MYYGILGTKTLLYHASACECESMQGVSEFSALFPTTQFLAYLRWFITCLYKRRYTQNPSDKNSNTGDQNVRRLHGNANVTTAANKTTVIPGHFPCTNRAFPDHSKCRASGQPKSIRQPSSTNKTMKSTKARSARRSSPRRTHNLLQLHVRIHQMALLVRASSFSSSSRPPTSSSS
jgi:hypothetical protein